MTNVMRERTTWIKNDILAKAASLSQRTAEDPRAMNQDHLSQQPAADAYQIGGPSEFAEDIHPSSEWKADDKGGETARNEIGMPDFRPETFNHSEKTAGEEDPEMLRRKAELCAKVARQTLPKTASDQMVEDQAFAFMHLPDTELVSMSNRLAGLVVADDDEDDDEDEDEGQSQSQGQQQGKEATQQQDEDKKQSQQQQQAQQDEKKQSQGQQQQGDKEAAQQQQQAQGQQQGDKEEDDDKGQQKEACGDTAMAQALQGLQAGDQQQMQAAIQQMVQQAIQQQMGQQQQQMSQQQQMDPMAQQQQQMAQQQQMSDDQLLDQMLQDDGGMGQQDPGMMMASEADDFELAGASVDMGVSLDASDAALQSLFANNSEYQDAAKAHELTTGVPLAPVQASQGSTRTASTRTVGTRPTQGVSQLGGAAAGSPSGGGEVDKLSSLWQSAPDVKKVFG